MSHVILQTTSDNASAITSGQSEECNLKIRQPVINPFAKVSKKYYNQHGLRVKKKLTSGIWFCIDTWIAINTRSYLKMAHQPYPNQIINITHHPDRGTLKIGVAPIFVTMIQVSHSLYGCCHTRAKYVVTSVPRTWSHPFHVRGTDVTSYGHHFRLILRRFYEGICVGWWRYLR